MSNKLALHSVFLHRVFPLTSVLLHLSLTWILSFLCGYIFKVDLSKMFLLIFLILWKDHVVCSCSLLSLFLSIIKNLYEVLLCDYWLSTSTPRTKSIKKRCPFHYRGLEYKSRNSRDTWSNRQIWPWSTKLSREKANRVLPRESTGHTKYPVPAAQEKALYKDITRWSTLKSDWLYSWQSKMGKPYTVSKNKIGSWLWLRSWTPYCKIQT